MSARAVVAVAISVVAVCAIANTRSELVTEDNNFAIRYLRNYGYLKENTQSFRTDADKRDQLRHSISLFQEYYKLTVTGDLTDETLIQMRKPRCGLRDVLDQKTDANVRRWPKTHITWNFNVADKETFDVAQAAFDIWQSNSALTFERVVLNPNILISWREGKHMNIDPRNGQMCDSPLDGLGGVLAHAFYPSGHPNFTSEVHVDRAEPWHIHLDQHPKNTFNLLYVLTHEIGHSLGLSHNPSKNSIMYAYATEETYPVTLSNEDVLNIQNLYGSPSTNVPPTRPPPTTPTPDVTPRNNVPTTDLCELQRFDGILLLEKRMYITSGQYIWPISLNEKTYDKPLSISNYLRFLPSNFTRVSAAYQTPSGHIMLFVDNKIYKVNYPSFSLDSSSSWPITFAAFGLPPNAKINAAVNSNQGRSYVMYDNRYVGEIDECREIISKHYLRSQIFPGIPPKITSAFRYLDGNLYFISRKQFYKFNEFTKTVLSSGKFDLQIVDIACPRYGLLQQLRDLLNRIARTSNSFANDTDNSDEEEENEET